MLASLESAGIDISGAVTRVPNGIEADAVVTDAEILELTAMGAEVLEPGQELRWGFQSAAAAADSPLLTPPAPTVRVVRADWFTTKGQGFL